MRRAGPFGDAGQLRRRDMVLPVFLSFFLASNKPCASGYISMRAAVSYKSVTHWGGGEEKKRVSGWRPVSPDASLALVRERSPLSEPPSHGCCAASIGGHGGGSGRATGEAHGHLGEGGEKRGEITNKRPRSIRAGETAAPGLGPASSGSFTVTKVRGGEDARARGREGGGGDA